MKLPLSGFIITKNEALNIARAIKSMINIVDDLYIIDSGSTDATVEIAKNLGVTVIYNKWPGYVKQKAYGESLCKHKWILNIDGDEEISTELENEIYYLFTANLQDNYKAYKLTTTIIHRFDAGPRKFAPTNPVIRLYNTDYASYASANSSTHDSVVFRIEIDKAKEITTLSGRLWHRSGASLTQLVDKANFYSSEQAEDLYGNKRYPSNLRLIGEFFLWFFKAFFIRRYFIFGINGFIDSVVFAFARFLRLAKVREKFRENIKLSK